MLGLSRRLVEKALLVIAIATIIVIALLYVTYRLYSLPAGSMQPTLCGSGDYVVGDKVLVNFYRYFKHDYKRWELLVFEFPYLSVSCKRCGSDLQSVLVKTKEEAYKTGRCDMSPECRSNPLELSFSKKDYVKRCVGVPGDELAIRDGNIVSRKNGVWKPLVKNVDVQAELWQAIFDSEEKSHVVNKDRYWKGGTSYKKWMFGQPIKFTEGHKEVLSFYASKQLRGYGDKGPSRYKVAAEDISPASINLSNHKIPFNAPLVGDVKIGLELLNQPSSGVLVLELYWNRTPYIMQVDFSSKKISIKVASKVIKDLSFNEMTDVSFSKLDGQLWIENGEQLIQVDIPRFDVRDVTKIIIPKIRYEGDALSLSRIQIFRDIYYESNGEFLSDKNEIIYLEPNEYFVLGDNSFFSYDSRYWGTVPLEKILGKAEAVIYPIERARWLP